jgi:hydrophobe/amphiphile efflux-1 (HAE1) family protein
MIWNFCIRRPVFTVVMFLVMAIFGVWAASTMPVRENPDVEFPIVSVSVFYPGAEPEVVETQIVEYLEEEINTIEGLKTLTSSAREQAASVSAEFELWRDLDIAAQDVRDAVNRALNDLPEDAERPLIQKLDPGARAIMWIPLIGDQRWDPVRLTDYADRRLKPRLENIRGVGRILIGGEKRFAVRIQLDPARLAAHDLTPGDVVQAVQENNVNIPTGRVESVQREFLVKTQGRFSGPEPFNDIIVAQRDGAPIRLSDVGRAVPGVEFPRQAARFAGENAVALGVIKRSGANTVSVAGEVIRTLERLQQEEFPSGLSYDIAADDSVYIKQSIRDLAITIAGAALLVVAVVLGFLRNLRGTFITGLAIPTSLFGGVAAMSVLGFSINILTMLGLILAIGIVIDDAIVILESAYRRQEHGDDPMAAARDGTSEVAFPSIANTVALAAVFIPVAFTAGIIGRYFYEFSLTVAVTVFASTFTALTLTPMLCSRFLRLSQGKGRLERFMERMLDGLDHAYSFVLDKALAHRAFTLAAALSAMALGGFLFTRLSTEFTPTVDRSQFMISFRTAEGATLAETDAYAAKLEKALAETDEVEHQFMAIGLSEGDAPGKANEGIMFVRLIPRARRDVHQADIMQRLRGRFARIPGGRAFVISTGGGPTQGAPLQLVLQSSNLDRLADQQQEVMAWMRSRPDLLGVNTDLRMNKPQARLRVLRDKASQMGVSVADVSNALRYLLGEPEISEIERDSERYEVITETGLRGRMVPDALLDVRVRTASGELVSLAGLVAMEEDIGPSEIHHFNRLRSATISASTPPDATLGDVMSDLSAYLERTLPPGFSYTFTGQSQDFQESFANLSLTMIFSVVFIYLVLAAQFESFTQPLLILIALPLAGVGAAVGLYLMNLPNGIYAFIGLIMLMGMAAKNAILMMDYTNILAKRGSTSREAAREAAKVRFRPVIMTTISTVLGLLPIALGLGAGGEARMPMGVAVTCGLLATTLLTLGVLPVVYTVYMDAAGWMKARLKR